MSRIDYLIYSGNPPIWVGFIDLHSGSGLIKKSGKSVNPGWLLNFAIEHFALT